VRIALRFRRIPRTIAVLAAALAVAAWTGTASAQSADVAACVRDNLVKYAAPDRAVVDQYLSIEAACEAYINGDPSAQISVTPIDGNGGAGRGTSGSSGSSTDGAGSGGTTTSPSGAAAGSGGGGSGGATTASDPEARGTAKGGGDAVALATAGKIAPADAGSPSAVSAITDAPIWLILLLVLVVAGVAAGVVMGARRHTK